MILQHKSYVFGIELWITIKNTDLRIDEQSLLLTGECPYGYNTTTRDHVLPSVSTLNCTATIGVYTLADSTKVRIRYAREKNDAKSPYLV